MKRIVGAVVGLLLASSAWAQTLWPNNASVSGSIAAGDLTCGGPGVTQLQDCGSVNNYGAVQPGLTSGSTSGSAWNTFTIQSDALDASTAGAYDGWQFNYTVGGSNLKAVRNGIDSILNFTATSSASNPNRNYVGGIFQMNASANDGGTNTGAGAQGAMFGSAHVVRAHAAAQNLLEVTAAEFDTVSETSSSMKARFGISIVGWGSVNGATYDAAIELGTAAGGANTAGWLNGILLAHGFNGNAPLATNGCVICTDGSADTIAKGIDLSAFTISGNFLASPGFTVGGTGIITDTLAGAASAPVFNLTGAWFSGGTTSTTTPQAYINGGGAAPTWSTSGTGLAVNGANGFGGNLLALYTNGTAEFVVNAFGGLNANGSLVANANKTLLTAATGGASGVQIGNADAASPVAQVLSIQSGSGSNIAGQNFTVIGSRSTGSGTSGDIIFQTGGTGAGASALNAATTALTIKGATQLVQLPAITSDATHTDSTVCQDTTTHALYAGSGAAGICLGTSSARFKTDIAPLAAGLDEVLRTQTVSYRYLPGYGDPSRKLYGFTAEQVSDVLPELVGLDAQGRPNSVDWAGMVPVLVRAIQQQQAEIEHLKRKIR